MSETYKAPPVSGYRDLSQAEIDLMNEMKALEEQVAAVLKRASEAVPDHHWHADEQRWLSLARTHLETGFMFAIKAVARPTNGMGRNR